MAEAVMTTYDTLFWGSVLFLVGLYVPSFFSKKNNTTKLDLIYPQFKSFQTKWLSIYYLALGTFTFFTLFCKSII